MPKLPEKRPARPRPRFQRTQSEPSFIELKTGDVQDIPDFVDPSEYAQDLEPTPLPSDIPAIIERSKRRRQTQQPEAVEGTETRRHRVELLDALPSASGAEGFFDPTPTPSAIEGIGQPTRILPRDPERAVPTSVLGADRLEAAVPTNILQVQQPEETRQGPRPGHPRAHEADEETAQRPLPNVSRADEETAQRPRPGVPPEEETAQRPRPALPDPDQSTLPRRRPSPPAVSVPDPPFTRAPQRPPSASDRPPPPVTGPSSLPVLEPAFLVIAKGPGAGKSVPLPEGELTVGRASSSGLKLEHASVSRHHATVIRQNERFFLRDAGSHNGSFVNGRRVKSQIELRSGDEIGLGKVSLTFRWGGTDSGSTSTAIFVPALERPGVKVAIFGGAVALGIASFALVWELTAGSSPADEEQRVEARDERQPEVRAAAVAAAESDESGTGLSPTRVERPRQDEVEMPAPVQEAEAPAANEGRGDLSLVNEPSASRVFEEAKARGEPYMAEMELPKRFVEKRPSRPTTTKKPARKQQKSGADDSQALAAYEAGDVERGIRLAKAAGNAKLAAKMASFQKEFAAAKSDLSFKDGAGAIKHFTAALAIDDELSGGWGKAGGEIRVQLSGLYQMAGAQALASGSPEKAAAFYERSLKYDPTNEKAKSGLKKARVGTGEPAAAPTPAREPAAEKARSAADEAFEN